MSLANNLRMRASIVNALNHLAAGCRRACIVMLGLLAWAGASGAQADAAVADGQAQAFQDFFWAPDHGWLQYAPAAAPAELSAGAGPVRLRVRHLGPDRQPIAGHEYELRGTCTPRVTASVVFPEGPQSATSREAARAELDPAKDALPHLIQAACDHQLPGLPDFGSRDHAAYFMSDRLFSLYYLTHGLRILGPDLLGVSVIQRRSNDGKTVYLTPQGAPFDMRQAYWTIDCKTRKGAVVWERGYASQNPGEASSKPTYEQGDIKAIADDAALLALPRSAYRAPPPEGVNAQFQDMACRAAADPVFRSTRFLSMTKGLPEGGK